MTMFDPIEDLLALSKAGATGGKYYKRVPKGGGKKGYDYFYTKEAYEKKHSSDHVGGDAASQMNAGSNRIKEIMHAIPSSELGQHSPQRTQIQDTVDRAEDQFQAGNHTRAVEKMKLAVLQAERVGSHIRDKREYAADAAKRQAAVNKKYSSSTESAATSKPKGSKHHEVEVRNEKSYKGVAEVSISDDSKPGGQEFHKYQVRGATAKAKREHAMALHAERHGITKPIKSVNKYLRQKNKAKKDNAAITATSSTGSKSGEKRTVKIAGNQGPMEVEAKVFGAFAVHDGTITHLPTGMVVARPGTAKASAAMARHLRNEIGAKHDDHKFIFGDGSSLPDSARNELRAALGSFNKSGGIMDAIEEMEALSKAGGPYIGKQGGKYADAAHKISWGSKEHKTHKEKAAYTEAHDSHNGQRVNNLHMHADNDQQLYNQASSIKKNLINKMASGKYDAHQARKLWQYHADATAKQKDGPGGTMHDRRQMAHENEAAFRKEAGTGEHDDHLMKKHQGKGGTAAKANIDAASKMSAKMSMAPDGATTADSAQKLFGDNEVGKYNQFLAQANDMHAAMTGKAMAPASTKKLKDSNWDANKDAAEAGYHEVALAGKQQKTPKGAEGGFYPTVLKSERDHHEARHFNTRRKEFVQFADEPSANPLIALRKSQEAEQIRLGSLYGRGEDLVKSGTSATCAYHSAMGRSGGEHVAVPVCTCSH